MKTFSQLLTVQKVKIITAIAFFFIANFSFIDKARSQWTGSTVLTTTTSNVGIGTTSPASLLHVVNGEVRIDDGGLRMYSPTDVYFRTISANSDVQGINILSGTNGADGSGIRLFAKNATSSTYYQGAIQFISNQAAGSAPSLDAFQFINYDVDNSTWNSLFKIRKEGSAYLYAPVDRYMGKNETGLLIQRDDLVSGSLGSGAPSKADIFQAWKRDYAVTGAPNTMMFSIDNDGNTYNAGNAHTKLHLTVDDGATINPNSAGDALTVAGNVMLLNADPAYYRQIRSYTNTGGITLATNTDGGNSTAIVLNGIASSTKPGCIGFVANGTSPSEYAFQFMTYAGGTTWNPIMNMRKDSRVEIGNITSTPPGYKLYVEQGILTERVKVANMTDHDNWSDFVFNDNYNLKSLKEVEAYIRKNKHLQDIPSADDVSKNGIDLAEMDAKLLQKIEELTLYVIEQNKKIDAQQKEIVELKKQKRN